MCDISRMAGGRTGHDAAAALGHFMISWAHLESVLEVAIHKQLGTDPVKSSIVTAGLQFKSKTSVLLSLLNLDAKKYDAAIKTLKKIRNRSERNDIVHGIVAYHPDGIGFMRRRVDEKFKSTKLLYSPSKLTQLAEEFEALSVSLAGALGLKPEEFNPFFHSAHKAANKASGSP